MFKFIDSIKMKKVISLSNTYENRKNYSMEVRNVRIKLQIFHTIYKKF